MTPYNMAVHPVMCVRPYYQAAVEDTTFEGLGSPI